MTELNNNYCGNNTELALRLLNGTSKNGKVYTEEDLQGTVGVLYTRINDRATKEPLPKITRFSDLPKDWHTDSECPKCKRLFVITNEKLNTMSVCKCGQPIVILATEKIL